MSATSDGGEDALPLESLARLKAAVPGTKLKKHAGGGGGNDPFPVGCRMPLESFPASAYDVPSATLRATIHGPGAPSMITVDAYECEGLDEKVLERAKAGLAAAIPSLLRTPSTPSTLATALPSAAAAAFLAAVRSLAEVEPYETVDASGATVRRFAVVRAAEEQIRRRSPATSAPAARTPYVPPRPSAPSSPSCNEAAEAELRFLERRFGPALSVADDEAGGRGQRPRRCRFRVEGFVPSDPSWTHGPVSLLGTIDFGAYPSRDSFSLLAREEGDDGGSSVAAARLTLALRRASASDAPREPAGPGGPLRSLVRLADSRGGELSAAPQKAEEEEEEGDEEEGEEGGEEEEEEEETESERSRDSESDTGRGSDTGRENDEREGCTTLPRSPAAAARRPAAAPGGGARFSLSLSSLSLDGVDALSPASLSLELECLRCRGAVLPPPFSFAGGGGGSSWSSDHSSPPPSPSECPTCRSPLSASAEPRIAHALSSAVAVVRCSGCVPVDALVVPSSSFGAQCERCAGAVALRGSLRAGGGGGRDVVLRRPCPSCHASLCVSFDSCVFEKIPELGTNKGGGSGAAARGGANRSRKKKNGAPGDDDGGGGGDGGGNGGELPRRGACDHYPHSHRAMRFPCCGRAYPCDVCHELAASDPRLRPPHPPEVSSEATRMICGFCRKEQPFEKRGDPAVCRCCGRHLAGSSRHGEHGARTRHWEGGKGCRDPKLLDRRDAKKHSGSRFKTRSKKSSRVGQKQK